MGSKKTTYYDRMLREGKKQTGIVVRRRRRKMAEAKYWQYEGSRKKDVREKDYLIRKSRGK